VVVVVVEVVVVVVVVEVDFGCNCFFWCSRKYPSEKIKRCGGGGGEVVP
jgi:hypothetical protein